MKYIIKNNKKVIIFIFCIIMFTSVCSAERLNMTYLYGGTTAIYKSIIENTHGAISTVSPSYFDIDSKGTLKIHSIDTSFIEEMHSKGITITPFVSNHWDRPSGILALEKRKALAQDLANAVYEYNLDGVNVDIENVTHLHRSEYSDFVRLLRKEMPDKIISVAVAANPSNWNIGWHGSYDYAALAEHSDYLVIMAYDESYYGSEPGAVASLQFVEKSIKYALERVSPDKIVVALPFYGRYWPHGAKGGSALTAKDADYIMKNYSSTFAYNEKTQTMEATVIINDNDIKPKIWGGKILEAGIYDIYYDDLQALTNKLGLVGKYNLRGSGSWALSQEIPEIWNSYIRAVNNYMYISDTISHWAENEIDRAYEKGWMVGVSHILFDPESPMTRAQSAAILVRVCGLENAYAISTFSDIIGHWAEREIEIARTYGLVYGVDEKHFEPDRFISREEFAALADRAFVLSEAVDYTEVPFVDVAHTDWSYNSVNKLAKNGIIAGKGNNIFDPKGLFTRSECAFALDKLSGFGIKDTNPYLPSEEITLSPR